MSIILPLRVVRIPILQRQCLFQRHRILIDLPSTSPALRSFSSTPSRPGRGQGASFNKSLSKTAEKYQTRPAPQVDMEKAQQEGEFIEDLGLLENTFVRAPYSKLEQDFWTWRILAYYWKFLKSKLAGILSRISYQRCIYKKGTWKRLQPIDRWNHGQIRILAKKYYEQLYADFAKGDIAPIQRVCLTPLAKDFSNRIAARGLLKMEWKLLNWKSARVMSHRVTSLGEAYPDTAFRQVVVRLESEQKLNLRDDTYSKSALHPNSRYSLKALTANSRRWIPEEASTKIHKAEPKLGRQINASRSPGDTKGEDQGEITRVVEYLVMQKRVINRKEDEKWKIWGFVEESTPQKLEDDDEYWRKYNSAQAAAVA